VDESTSTVDGSSKPYLWGYTLPFDDIVQLICKSLIAGKMPMVGVVYTDSEGGYKGGHYFRITSTYLDPETQERYFVTADSDDDKPVPAVVSARSLVPMINRIHLPSNLARPVNARIEAQSQRNEFYVPTLDDGEHYAVVPVAEQPSA
jgi:hypothetical protein